MLPSDSAIGGEKKCSTRCMPIIEEETARMMKKKKEFNFFSNRELAIFVSMEINIAEMH